MKNKNTLARKHYIFFIVKVISSFHCVNKTEKDSPGLPI